MSITPLPVETRGLSVAATPDGKIWAVGGLSGSAESDQLFVYDPATDAWSQAASMNATRTNSASCTGLDGRIYTFGGRDGLVSRTSAEVYDPTLNAWHDLAPLTYARESAYAVTAQDGRIYVFGGHDSTAPNVALATVEVYTPWTDSWAPGTTMPSPRDCPAAAVAPNGQIVVLGGSNEFEGYLNSVDVLDPTTQAWSSGPAMSVPRLGPVAGWMPDGKLYVAGGYNSAGGYLATTECLTLNGFWTAGPTMSLGRTFAGGAVGADGHLYCVGGEAGGAAVSSVEALFLDPGSEITGLDPSETWIGVTNSDNNGRRVDTLIELLHNGEVVGSGQALNVQVAGNATNGANSTKVVVPMSLVSNPVPLPSGSELAVRVSIRRNGGSGNFGVRFFYAGPVPPPSSRRGYSRINPRIDGTPTWLFLREGAALDYSPGTGVQSHTLTVTPQYEVVGTWHTIVP